MPVVRLAEKARLVKLDHVALDGAKIKANAAKRMKRRELELASEVNLCLTGSFPVDFGDFLHLFCIDFRTLGSPKSKV